MKRQSALRFRSEPLMPTTPLAPLHTKLETIERATVALRLALEGFEKTLRESCGETGKV